MNAAESEIAAAVANLRGQNASTGHRLAAGSTRERHQRTASIEDGKHKVFDPPVPRDGRNLDHGSPWPDKPGVRRQGAKGLSSLGYSPVAWGITTLLLVTSGIVVAFHDSGASPSSVIVHLVWPA